MPRRKTCATVRSIFVRRQPFSRLHNSVTLSVGLFVRAGLLGYGMIRRV